MVGFSALFINFSIMLWNKATFFKNFKHFNICIWIKSQDRHATEIQNLLSSSSFSEMVKWLLLLTPPKSSVEITSPLSKISHLFYYFTYKMPDLNWDLSIVQINLIPIYCTNLQSHSLPIDYVVRWWYIIQTHKGLVNVCKWKKHLWSGSFLKSSIDGQTFVDILAIRNHKNSWFGFSLRNSLV